MNTSLVIKIIVGYVILSLYNNLLPIILGLDGVLWLVIPTFFFFILFWVAKATGKTLHDFGLTLHKGWINNLLTGWLIGFVSYSVLVALSCLFVRFAFHEFRSTTEILLLLVFSIVGMFLGSFLNDLITKGYVYGQFKDSISSKWLFVLILLIYSFDDIWYEGFSISNTLFSILLGLSLVYCLFKTGSIWMTTGIHWGWNLMYSLMYGLPGTGEQGGIFAITVVKRGVFFQFITIGVCIVMFIVVMLYFHFNKKNRVHIRNSTEFKL